MEQGLDYYQFLILSSRRRCSYRYQMPPVTLAVQKYGMPDHHTETPDYENFRDGSCGNCGEIVK